MPNAFNAYTPQQVADVALAATKGAFKLASIAKTFGPDAFKEGRGNTVYLNVPGALTARSRALGEVTASIVLDSLAEAQEPVSLDVHAYSAVGLSERDLSLDLVDFSKQVLVPQVDAVVAKIESTVADVLAGVTADATITGYSADRKSVV